MVTAAVKAGRNGRVARDFENRAAHILNTDELTSKWKEYTTAPPIGTRAAPQGSQLGPTLWKVAMTLDLRSLSSNRRPRKSPMTILIMVGAARPPLALEFSAEKHLFLSLKGGLKPGYSVGFGSADLAPRIASASTAKYIDPRKSYWDHVVAISSKSASLYRRLRNLYSANWRMKNTAARMIYRGVFLPRVTYASEIWANGGQTREESKETPQRSEGTATGHKRGPTQTSSTNCPGSSSSRTVPLDLEVRQQALQDTQSHC
ncbi:uncharacterized protein LOC132953314 [Metopolophium dirhodum]|uniref:uncharacterized protein LOC132953314 n=1 Tax=Metopolophium dirhodum TaxID=44670 RepID=UPI00299009E5|nr:uncharacterized protein LOC132953314 [Metopolophium dirhodum]